MGDSGEHVREGRAAVTEPPAPRTRATRPRTIGPVPDREFERHLPREWWRMIFNAAYLRTDGDVVENAENTAREVDWLVRAADLTTDRRVLDLCCGQGRHCLDLARRGFTHVTGLDRSRYLVTLARKRAQAAGLKASFHEGDARRFRLAEAPFDAVALLGNSFGYFDHAEDDLAVLASVRRALSPDGVIALDVSDGEWVRANFEPRSWEWVDASMLVCRERALSADGSRLVCREVMVHTSRGVVADQFYAQRLYSRALLDRLLKAADFGEVREHDELEAASDRNQDLGLMEHRFFVTARPGASRPSPRRPVEVLVLLGDQKRPDPIRPGGRFTPEDDDAVRRLKGALAAVEGYTFRYHDDHASLRSTLETRRPSLVLNFCDEGFGNDLRAELHVPALLDVFGVPYSGAGPACLGLCLDKSHVRAIAASYGIPVPRETPVGPDGTVGHAEVGFPAIVKPRASDGSAGIDRRSVVHTRAQLDAHLATARAERPDEPLLVQEFLAGAEYSVGVLGTAEGGIEALPVLEVDYDNLPADLPKILGYESKWNHPETPYWTDVHYREAKLADAQHEQLVAWSLRLFRQLGCRDYARFDFRTDAQGTIRLLEVNPNPGWGWGDEMNYMAGWAGLTYPQLLERILASARARVSAAR